MHYSTNGFYIMMKALIIALFAISATAFAAAQNRPGTNFDSGKKVICLYNSTTFIREGQ